jgi:hypothetical protein
MSKKPSEKKGWNPPNCPACGVQMQRYVYEEQLQEFNDCGDANSEPTWADDIIGPWVCKNDTCDTCEDDDGDLPGYWQDEDERRRCYKALQALLQTATKARPMPEQTLDPKDRTPPKCRLCHRDTVMLKAPAYAKGGFLGWLCPIHGGPLFRDEREREVALCVTELLQQRVKDGPAFEPDPEE